MSVKEFWTNCLDPKMRPNGLWGLILELNWL